MNRTLNWFNTLGVLVLVIVCAWQWRMNRELNLRINSLEGQRIEQQARLEEQDKQIKGQSADLDLFRERLEHALADVKVAESNFLVARREAHLLTAERDQLQESISQWTNAVAERDRELARAAEQIQQLGTERNEIVGKFNDLAQKQNELVETLNSRTREFNSLAERYNALAKSASRSSQ